MKSIVSTGEAVRDLRRDAPSSTTSFIASGLAFARGLQPSGQSLILLAARLLYGGLFIQTGFGKLANLERTIGFFESLHLPAPAFTAALVGGVELLGGVLLALGAGARFAAATLVGVMATALLVAHADEAFSSVSAFTEQTPFPFLAASLIVLGFGAGRFSLEGLWASRKAGAGRKAAERINDAMAEVGGHFTKSH